MSRIVAEVATVFRAPNGRRFFTKRAALRAAAWALIQKECYCEPCEIETSYPGSLCEYHENDCDLGKRIAERLIRRWGRAARQTDDLGKVSEQ